MNTAAVEKSSEKSSPAATLAHGLGPHFADLARFDSTPALEASELYRRLRPEVERLLSAVECDDFTPSLYRPAREVVRATAWNIERGSRFEGVLEVLAAHPSVS